MENILLRQSDIAKMLGVSRQRVYAMHKAGHLPEPCITAPVAMWGESRIKEWVEQRAQQKGQG